MPTIDPPAPTFVRYMEKSRNYYLAQGDPTPYHWAHFDEVPFAALPKALNECRIGLVTTTFLHPPPEDRPQLNWKRSYAAPWDPSLPTLFTDDLSWDKKATHTEDRESYLPLQILEDLVCAERIASVAPRFYGVPTEYSQRRTKERDAPQIVEWCQEDGLDAVLLVPL